MIKLFFSLVTVLFFLSRQAQSEENFRANLKDYGAQYSKQLGTRTSWWTGSDLLPSFTTTRPKQSTLRSDISNTILNTQTPAEQRFSRDSVLNGESDSDPNSVARRLGDEHQLREKFLQDVSYEVVSGRIADEYNFFINEARRLGCWRSDTPFSAQCKDLQNLGVGIFLALYSNQNVLGNSSIPIDRTFSALGNFLVGENISPELKIGIYSMLFLEDSDPSYLVNTGYLLNEKSKIFEDYGAGTLVPSISSTGSAEKPDQTQRSGIINQFRNSVDTLQIILNDKKRGWDLAASAALRIEEVKNPLKSILKKFPDEKFSVKEFYSGLGVLNQFYDSQAEFISLDHLKVFRGDLRSDFRSLTESTIERWLLWIWGALSGYGTSITGLTITLVFIFTLVLVLSFASTKSKDWKSYISDSVECYLSVLTIRGKAEYFWGIRWLLLSVEAVLFLFIPTYLGFLITFLLRSS